MRKEEEINMFLQKILNWRSMMKTIIFDVTIFSVRNGSQLLRRQITGQCVNDELQMNYALRISYPYNDQTISIRFAFQNKHCQWEKLTEFTVNLNILKERKSQYFPFGQNQRVLLICTFDKVKSSPHRPQEETTEAFIQEKQGYLQKVVQQEKLSYLEKYLVPKYQQAQELLKKNVSQKVMRLYNGVRNFTGRSPNRRLDSNYAPPMDNIARILQKSRSQKDVGELPKNSRALLMSRQASETSVYSNSSRRKLVLNTLKVIDVEGENVNDYSYSNPRQ